MTRSPLEKLQQDMSGFQNSCILAALAELDIPTALIQEGPTPLSSLAYRKDCDIRALAVLLDAATALGYLDKNGSDASALYSVAEGFRELLDSRHPDTQIPFLRHLACVMRSWTRLAWTVRDGMPHRGEASILGAEEDRSSFIMAMNSIGQNLVEGVMQSLEKNGVIDPGRACQRILDVGGASGTYAEAFLQRIPDSLVAIFDLPQGIRHARKRFSGHPSEGRIALHEGDFMIDPLPCGFDFAWVSAIIHQFDREQSRILYAKVHESLVPGGTLAIRDFVMEENRTSPAAGTLFGVNMLAQTPKGMVYTFAEIKEDLEAAGFTCIEHPVRLPTMCAIVTAKKPA